MFPGIVGFGKAAEISRLALTSDHNASLPCATRSSWVCSHGFPGRMPMPPVLHEPRTRPTSPFPGLEGEALVIALDLKGLACSTGAACSSGAVEPSHVLTAIGLTAPEARSSIRFSLGRHTDESEIEAALQSSLPRSHNSETFSRLSPTDHRTLLTARPFFDGSLSGRNRLSCTIRASKK